MKPVKKKEILNHPSTRNLTLLSRTLKQIKKDRQLLIIFLPCLVYYIIFRYGPIYGLVIAFKEYNVFVGILESPWVGFKYFIQFFSTSDFFLLFKNSILLGVYSLLWGFPLPIIFALFLNEIRNEKFKKFVQTSSYLPSFLSVVIVCSMVVDFLSPSRGIVNQIIAALGFEKQYFLIKPEWFRTIYITSDIWFSLGFSSIIFMAAITTVDQSLYEAGKMDGCKRFRMMWHITIPGITPTIATMFILSAGNIIRSGGEKTLLLYNPLTYIVADVFSTFIYRKGLIQQNYSYGAAVGLFEAVVSLVLIISANRLSKKIAEQSLW